MDMHQQESIQERNSTFNMTERFKQEKYQLRALQHHYSSLVSAIIEPLKLGSELYSRCLIPESIWKNISLSSGIPHTSIVSSILDCIQKVISINPGAFSEFLMVLNQDPVTENVAKSIQQTIYKYQESAEVNPRKKKQPPTLTECTHFTKKRCTSLPYSVASIVDQFVNEEDVFAGQPLSNDRATEGDDTCVTSTASSIVDFDSNISKAFATAITSTTIGLGLNSASKLSPEIDAILLNELDGSEDEEEEPMHIERSLSLINPTGALRRKSHRMIYTKLFRMAWNGEDQQALTFVKGLKRNRSVSVDLKVVCMEVVHTVRSERDLKLLLSALAYTDRTECENKHILKCRLHRRIAGLHYRNGDHESASDHLVTALQLAEQLTPDIDSVYTMRLEALILFEEYKKNNDDSARKGAEKYFQRAMDHARQQPEWKRLITERIKISKALFHLDMINIYRKTEKSEEAIEQLQYRVEDTLDDVDDAYLTDGDKAFFYITYAKLKLYGEPHDLAGAEDYAKMALDINTRCGFEARRIESEQLLKDIKQLAIPLRKEEEQLIKDTEQTVSEN